ncbi:P-loop containing nucleoside triphosphate hydrolase protein [Xylariales sp. PMI_506]|nr:P-loop containing nucleoside triphosphate hydrolase protein [Xylariales sp. PMI_506]
MSDFDSGDDLFDGVDVDELATAAPSHKRNRHDDPSSDPASPKRHHQDSGNDASTILVAKDILAEKFGYQSFRHEQEAAIDRILHGENTLVVFPTGAGKSLCYQIPGIAFEKLDLHAGLRAPGEHGITIVVSPLIALMADQVTALKKRGVSAECLDSTKTWEQVQQITADMHSGKLRILYCAPERLNNEGFVEKMKHVKGGVRLLAVDEAHCISEWGHSFRPDYLKVARFVQEIKAERVICLTATATPRVVDDICKAFQIDQAGVFRTSPYRPNLELNAMAVQTKHDKYELLFQFLKEHRGSTLVYVTLQQQAESLATDLRNQGFSAKAFHAGMQSATKAQIQEDFMAGKIPIIVATIAFGMGIDKADIRTIVHFDLSATIEEYSQQIGRAGRDGKPSTCMFYICPEDRYLRENFARGDLPSKNSLRDFLKDIFSPEVASLPVGQTFKRSHYRQTKDFDIRSSPLGIIYAALELRFGLIRAITPEYSDYKFIATARYYNETKNDKSPEARAVFECATRGITGKAKWHSIDPKVAASRYGLLRVDVIRKLNQLHDSGHIELKAGGVEACYRILKQPPKTDVEIDILLEQLYADLESREDDAINRVEAVIDLITGEKCFALALSQHFGIDSLPEKGQKCGHCTYCFTGKRIEMPTMPKKEVDLARIQDVLDACPVRDDPRFLARVAFGIKSPRVVQLKLDRSNVFMSLADHDFKSLLREFERACQLSDVKKESV